MTVPGPTLKRSARAAPVVTRLGDTFQPGDTGTGGFIP